MNIYTHNIYIYIYICIYVSLSLSIYIYVYIYTHIYVYIYIYIVLYHIISWYTILPLREASLGPLPGANSSLFRGHQLVTRFARGSAQYIYIYIYICIYIYIYMRMCIYIYIYVLVQTRSRDVHTHSHSDSCVSDGSLPGHFLLFCTLLTTNLSACSSSDDHLVKYSLLRRRTP